VSTSTRLKKEALSFLSVRRKKPVTLKELARTLRINDRESYQTLRTLVHELVREGTVEMDPHGNIRYVRLAKKPQPPAHARLTGRLVGMRGGGGIVRSEETGEEIFVPRGSMGTALHGDMVAALRVAGGAPRHQAADRRPEGEIIAVLERVNTHLTGRLEKSRTFAFVIPDHERITRDIYVPLGDAEAASDGDKVVVELLPWTDEHLNPEGRIVEVLGPSGDARVEVVSVARSFSLPLSFPEEAEREAGLAPATLRPEDLAGRLDLRGEVVFTIDPEDAKDFDDAVSLEPLAHDGLRLGVHIADVSYYVREGSALDREAFARGTSVYMVNEVVPMLPERLSNDLCSLRPDEDRLTMSVVMDLNRHGTVEDYVIRESVIRSRRRFTYEEVEQVIRSGRGDHVDVILPLFHLSKVLLTRRRRSGSLDLDTPEVKFVFGKDGLPSEIRPKTRLDSHRLIEECMLLANKVVATHAGERPFLYRVHDVPNPDRLADLARFVSQFGFSLAGQEGITAKELQKLLDQAKGSEVETLIHEVVLRSMAKAVYETKNIGHFGLAFRKYAHFTSPIRRYPDLVVHRLLKEFKGDVPLGRLTDLRQQLPEIARQSSVRERLAQEAERASVRVMQVEYMKRHLGDIFEGVIAGVTNFGLFVEIPHLLIEGLVRVRDLDDDYYVFDEKRYALRGRSGGRVYRLGDHIRIRVAAIDAEEHEITFSTA